MAPVFKNAGERFTAKNCPVSLLSVVSKVFEKLVNNRIVDHLEKCGLFSDFQYGFRSSWSTADLLTVVSDRIAGAFNSCGSTWAVALDISKAFDRVRHAALLHKLKSMDFQVRYLVISSFLSNWWLQVVLSGRCSQKYPVNTVVPQDLILGPTHFCYTLMTFQIMLSVTLLFMLMILLSILLSILLCSSSRLVSGPYTFSAIH